GVRFASGISFTQDTRNSCNNYARNFRDRTLGRVLINARCRLSKARRTCSPHLRNDAKDPDGHGRLELISRSTRLDASELDHPGPLLGFFGDELAKVGGRAGKGCGTEFGEPGPDPWIGETGIDLSV